MDPGEDDTPSHFNQSNEFDNGPMYGAKVKELNMDNADKLLKKETPKVHWPDNEPEPEPDILEKDDVHPD